MRILAGLVLLTPAAGMFAAAFGFGQVPPRYLPWTPLVIADEPNLLTGFKLARLKGDPALCVAVLRASELRHAPVPDSGGEDGCGLSNAVRVTGSGLASGQPFLATCPLAVAWAMFERHALQPAAQSRFGQPVTRVGHLGTYACRNVNNSESGRRSEHATANAIDVSAFGLRDGREMSIRRGWQGGDPAEAAFLRDLRDGACRFFNAVLGPDYNALHHDHFHLDMGGLRTCR